MNSYNSYATIHILYLLLWSVSWHSKGKQTVHCVAFIPTVSRAQDAEELQGVRATVQCRLLLAVFTVKTGQGDLGKGLYID